jgi:hypothetical protein
MRAALRITVALALVMFVSWTAAAKASAQPAAEKYDDIFRKYTKRFFGPGFDWRLCRRRA